MNYDSSRVRRPIILELLLFLTIADIAYDITYDCTVCLIYVSS